MHRTAACAQAKPVHIRYLPICINAPCHAITRSAWTPCSRAASTAQHAARKCKPVESGFRCSDLRQACGSHPSVSAARPYKQRRAPKSDERDRTAYVTRSGARFHTSCGLLTKASSSIFCLYRSKPAEKTYTIQGEMHHVKLRGFERYRSCHGYFSFLACSAAITRAWYTSSVHLLRSASQV